jgi:hypothetical protein
MESFPDHASSSDIPFPPPSGDWGTITHWMIVLPEEPEPKE